jgi:predicted Zn-dependent peptidase
MAVTARQPLTAADDQFLQRDARLRMGRLDNGLTYYIYPNQTPKGEAVYRLFVKAGSVQERDDQQGLAHFLEHLAFNGTRHFPGDGIVRFLESRGAKFGKDLNAHTSFTETVYKLQLPTTDPLLVDSTLTILSDWAGGLLISPDEVEKERGVILSERLARSGTRTDYAMSLVYELLNGSLYSRRITIGDTAVIRQATPETIRQYYTTWYRPELMAVAVVGDVDVDEVERMIGEKFAGIPAHANHTGKTTLRGTKTSSAAPFVPPAIPAYTAEEARIVTTAGATSVNFDILMLLPQPPSVQTADDYRQYLERSLMNSLAKQRLNALSFGDPAYASGSIQYSRFLGATGATDASVELTPGKVRRGIHDFVVAYRQMLAYGFTTLEIERAKKQLVSRLENKVKSRADETSTAIMNEIYSDFYDGNRCISRTDELALVRRFLPQIDSLSMVQFLQRHFETRPQHYLLRGGEDVKREVSDEADLSMLVDSARQVPVARYWHNVKVPTELTTLPPQPNHIVSERAIDAIGATDLRLDNGVRVIFRHSDTEHDRLTLSAFRKGGQYGLDSTRYYTALIGPSVVSLSGAGDFSREALSHYLTGKTASVRLLVDKYRTGVAASAHTADIETMFQLLYLRWTQPRLDTAVCRMTLDKLREGYRTRRDTPKDIFTRELGWLMNGRSYTNETLTDSIIDHCVDTADVLPLQHRFYGPGSGYTFVILADCALADVRGYINTYLGALPSGPADTTWVAATRRIPQHDVEYIRHTSDQPKATVSLVYQQQKAVGTLLEHELKGEVLKNILRTALLKRLREEMGKVYSVSTSVAATQYPSFLSRATIAFLCQPEDVDVLVQAVSDELQQLYDHPDRYASVLADVKQNLLKEHALQQQQTAYWTSFIRNSIFNNQEDWTWPARYAAVVGGLTMSDIAAFARHTLHDAHRIKAVLLPAVADTLSAEAYRPVTEVSGTVYEDRNGNGRRDSGERLLKGILVSNGDTIVRTDKRGRYTLPYIVGSSILPILPADYTLGGSRIVNANFHFLDATASGTVGGTPDGADFGLIRKPVARRFRLNAIGDVQVGNYQELDYATCTLWPELLTEQQSAIVSRSAAKKATTLPAVNLFLGDLVNNNLKLYHDLRTLMEQLPQQSWTVLGNHDRDVDTVRWRQTRSYNEVFGADMYAFNEGRVHFIVLNNVYGEGARGYRGMLSERQLRFVEQDLKYVPSDRLIVLSMHIPLAHTRNHDRLLQLLQGRGDVLAVTGHMHQVGRFFLDGPGVRVHELSAGASCGFWWVGERGADGVPAALQQDGTPRNYFVLDFDDTRYSLRCKAIDRDEHHQMNIHVTGIDTLEHHLRDMKEVEQGLLVMTVYGGCDSTRVRCRIDGGEWQECQKTKMIDPNVMRAREMNLRRTYPTLFNRMNPLRHRESQQLWTFSLPEACRRGAHVVEVEAADRWGFKATGRRSFCFPSVLME